MFRMFTNRHFHIYNYYRLAPTSNSLTKMWFRGAAYHVRKQQQIDKILMFYRVILFIVVWLRAQCNRKIIAKKG